MTRRILVVSHEASRTGAPRVAGHLLVAFEAGGWDTVLVHRWGGPMREELDALAHRSFLEPAARVRAVLRRRTSTRRLADYVERQSARRVLLRERPDVVWCNTVIAAPYAIAALELGIPVVVHSHEQAELVSVAVRRTGLVDPNRSRDPRLVLVGCATATAESLAAELGIDARKVSVLHSPVDVKQLRVDSESHQAAEGAAPMVLGCGSGDVRKGIDTFNAAAELSRSAGSSTAWVWVGKVPDALRVDAVTYPGEVSSALSWIATADLVVLPSRNDPFPLVVLEAMAVGTPVVASEIAGPIEQLAETGRYVPPGDAVALMGAVEALLSDQVLRAELGRLAAVRCELLWDVIPFGRSACEIAENALALGRSAI